MKNQYNIERVLENCNVKILVIKGVSTSKLDYVKIASNLLTKDIPPYQEQSERLNLTFKQLSELFPNVDINTEYVTQWDTERLCIKHIAPYYTSSNGEIIYF